LVQPGYTAEGVTNGVVASTAAINDKDRLVFVPSAPFKITKSQNRNFEVRCDIMGGKTTDTIKFYLDETGDLLVTDKQYGFGSNLTNNLGTSNVTAVTLQGGKLTFVDNGPVATNLSVNSTLRQLFNFSVTAGRDVTVRDFWLLLEQTTWDNTSAAKAGDNDNSLSTTNVLTDLDAGAISAAGVATFQTDIDESADMAVGDIVKLTVATAATGTAGTHYARITTVGANSSTADVTAQLIYPSTTTTALTWVDDAAGNEYVEVFDAHLASRVKNLKLVDLGTGSTLASSTTSLYALSFSDDFDISAGKTRNLSIQADLDTTLAAANAFKAGFDFDDTNFVRDNEANEFIAAGDIVGGALFGKTMTAVAASLTVSLASTPVSETHVKGTSDVDVGGFSVRAGDGGSVKVTRATVRLMADDDGTFDNSGYGDTGANTLVTSAGLYKVVGTTYTRVTGSTTDSGLTLVGTIGASGGYYKAQFLNLSHVIAKSDTEKWVVRVNLANTPSSTMYLATVVDADTDLIAQDSDGNTVTPSGNDLNLGASPTVTKTVATSGSIAVTEESSPNAAILVAGTMENVVARQKFSATNEAFKVTKLDVQLPEASVSGDPFDTTASTTAARSIVKVKVRYMNSSGVTETKEGILSAGVAKFTGLDLNVPKNATASMEILADLNTISAGAVTGDSIRLGLSTVSGYTFEAVGTGSSATVTTFTPANQANINTHNLRKAQPVVAKATTGLPTTLTNGTTKLYGFTVRADGGPVSMKRIVLTVTGALDASDTLSGFKLYRGTQDLSSNVSIFSKYGTDAESTTDITASTTSVSEKLTITWDDTTTREETVAMGTTNTYYLEAQVGGAGTGNNVSVNIADDSVQMTATNGVDEFKGGASIQGNQVVWRYDRGATDNTADCSDDFVYLDTNGDGTYTAAGGDFKISAANTTMGTTEGTCNSAATTPPEHNSFLGKAFITTAGTTDTTDDDTIFFDVTGGTYTAAADPLIVTGAILEPTSGTLTDGAAWIAPLLYQAAGFLYIDTNSGGTYSTGADYKITVTDATTPPTANTEIVTSNMNFVWSDQGEASGTVHATTTSAWTNGVNVDNLATQSLSLNF
ncbi:MAG: hypothetical protein AAB551_00365, partial [Patescibacteria group bacterium]